MQKTPDKQLPSSEIEKLMEMRQGAEQGFPGQRIAGEEKFEPIPGF